MARIKNGVEMIWWQVSEGCRFPRPHLRCRQGIVTIPVGPTSAPPEKLLGPMPRQHRGGQGIYTNRKTPLRKRQPHIHVRWHIFLHFMIILIISFFFILYHDFPILPSKLPSRLRGSWRSCWNDHASIYARGHMFVGQGLPSEGEIWLFNL